MIWLPSRFVNRILWPVPGMGQVRHSLADQYKSPAERVPRVRLFKKSESGYLHFTLGVAAW